MGAGASPDSPVTTVAAPRVLQPGRGGVPSFPPPSRGTRRKGRRSPFFPKSRWKRFAFRGNHAGKSKPNGIICQSGVEDWLFFRARLGNNDPDYYKEESAIMPTMMVFRPVAFFHRELIPLRYGEGGRRPQVTLVDQ